MEVWRTDMEKVCAGVEQARVPAPHMLLLRCSWHCSINLHVWTSVALGEKRAELPSACAGLWVLGLGPRSSVLFFSLGTTQGLHTCKLLHLLAMLSAIRT